MAIEAAIHTGSFVYIYNEQKSQTGMIQMDASDQLMGYTSSSVSVKRGSYIYVYDEKGNQKCLYYGA